MGEHYILLVKKIGRKKDTGPKITSTMKRVKTKDLLPGTLLRCIRDNLVKGKNYTMIFQVLDSEELEVDCSLGEMEQIETGVFELLYPIKNCSDRMNVYIDKKWLEEGKLMKKGDSVTVKLNIKNIQASGILRYKGNIREWKGTYFGIELTDHLGEGTSDGSCHGHHYFTCRQNNGIFCALNNLRKRKDGFEQSELARAEGKQYEINKNISKNVIKCDVNLGDRVCWLSDNGKHSGVVKWIGYLPDDDSLNITVGVEFDEPVGSGTGRYKTHRLFHARQNHASLVPLIGLIKEEILQDSGGSSSGFQESQHFRDSDFDKLVVNTSEIPSKRFSAYGSVMRTYSDMPMTDHRPRRPFSDIQSNLPTTDLVLSQSFEEIPSLPPKQQLKEPPASQTLSYRGQKIDQHTLQNLKIADSVVRKTEEDYLTNGKDGYMNKGMNPMYEYHKYDDNPSEVSSSNHQISDLSTGWRVTVSLKQHVVYGVIRWIGEVDGKETAGIETDDEEMAGTDGTFKGKRYFTCAPKHAFFVPLSKCKKDKRFYSRNSVQNGFGSLETPDVSGTVSPPSSIDETDLMLKICGKNRGIQGHHNSCYLDCLLFGMFYFTVVFDGIFYRPKNDDDIESYEEVQKVIQEGIVNPLRRNHYVRADKVMRLRELLHQYSSIPGMMDEEKDPEEFLSALLAHLMKADPFLHLSSGEHTYLYQLFMEKDDKILLPTTQCLLEISCLQGNIKLKEAPPCLIIQMPRFGKDYKMYNRIVPTLQLDITDILENSPRECSVCGKLAEMECKSCFHIITGETSFGSFCRSCSERIHQHPSRKSHSVSELNVSNDYQEFIGQEHQNLNGETEFTIPRVKMELFAVICIQTSHYVSFVKCGSGLNAPWVFFDSMADRMGEQSGYNIPEVTPVPHLTEWLSESNFEKMAHMPDDDKSFPEHMRRLLSDAYMCMYQSPEVMKFR